MGGLKVPVQPMEHHYLLTEKIDEIANFGSRLPCGIDYEANIYFRQEREGMLLGTYEPVGTPWKVGGTPWDFGHELLQPNLDNIADRLELAFERIPALAEAGIKDAINGPFTFGPDGNPMIGPVPGMTNYWCAVGVMAGFCQGGGVGLTMAEWMIDGEPSIDVWAMDVARFGDWIGPGYTLPKVIENYQKRFSVSYPNEELPAARPMRTTPMYDIFDTMGAVWGAQFGLEVPNYFAQANEPRYETPSFRRSNAWEATKREVMAVRYNVGINEVHNFGKYRITGRDVRAWLDRIMAGRIPKPGRLSLTPMLSHKGRLIGDFTVSCVSETDFRLTASYGSQAYHMRWFLQNQTGDVQIKNISDTVNGFQLAGPNAAKVLQAVTRSDVSAMKFMDAHEMAIGMVNCVVQRVSYTGDLGFEIYCHTMDQRSLWQALWSAGQAFDLKPFGMRAMMSLRLDKFFGSWLREFSPDYTAGETGIDRFISWKKDADFIGKSAAIAEREAGSVRALVAFEVEAEDADVVAYEPVWIDGLVKGFCTSGGYSHYADKSIALALVPREHAVAGQEAEIEILGQMRRARVITTPLFDADGARMRG